MEAQRLNAWLAARLGFSRRRADSLISQGSVRINGTPALLGQRVTEHDRVVVNGQHVPHFKTATTVILNKPVGFISSRSKQGRSQTIYALLPVKYHELKSAGRLDKDSSGLMLLSNDGQLIYRLTHPSFAKEKRYEVGLNKPLSPHNKALIEAGVTLDDGPSQLKLSGKEHNWLVTMHEGRNRQIRRTFKAVGYEVTSLHRISIGEYHLPTDLAPGKVQEL